MADIPEVLQISWLREQYLSKRLKPAEVIEEIIKRANGDRSFNIWITAPDDGFIRPFLEGLSTMDMERYPLWGIPFAIKDNIDLKGVPTTAGCAEFAYIPGESAVAVDRLVNAGAVPVGKTNMDQFATGLVGTRSPYGETHNAFREELISGGSSSGSAVAVARGQAAFSLGTDTAGSGRVPAALNNLYGYKPSLGAWPTKGVVPACASLDCVTVFANSLEDALAVDRTARGFEETDPWSRGLPCPVPERPRKILLPGGRLDFFGPYSGEYEGKWGEAQEKLKSLGMPVEYIDMEPFYEAAAILYEGPWIAERWADLGGFIEANPGAVLPVTEQILRSGEGGKYTAASLFKAIHRLKALRLETRKLLTGAVLAMPTSGGTWTREQARLDPIAANSAMGSYTNHCNLLDLCALAVPAGKAAPNTPFGITFFAPADKEALVCGAANMFSGNAGEPPAGKKETTCPSTGKKAALLVAVCGLHMRGFPLEKQLRGLGASFVREAATAAKYQFVKLPTVPPKPGLIKKPAGGASIKLEIWEMPVSAFGDLAASIPAPLGIGRVELDDGSEVLGFICEAHAAIIAKDISDSGGWRNTQ